MYEARLAAIAAEIQAGTFDWAAHALDAIAERTVTRDGVRTALTSGNRELIEDYPDAFPGPKCLVLCWVGRRALHVVLSYPPRPTIVTVYWPDSRPDEWDSTYRRRLR